MSSSARMLLVSLALWGAACQLAVDFPTPLGSRDAGPSDAAADAEPQLDAQPTSDAAPAPDGRVSDGATDADALDADTQDARVDVDTGPPARCELGSHAGCAADELCCVGAEGALCRATGASECSACGVACADPAAPHCGGRTCECEAGSGRGCAAGERCMGEAGAARCIQCANDAECAATPASGQCVAGRCVQCDRGSLVDTAADDEGCPQTAPICSPDNTCTACTREPDNCPAGSFCNVERGCLPCDVLRPAGANGCMGATPICRLTPAGSAACSGCLVDAECGMGGFCDATTGRCTTVCDPNGPLGDNGCLPATPYCDAIGDSFACRACTAADCTGATPYCAATGAFAGRCVACRDAADCALTADRPVCDATTAMCRARLASDCAGATPVLVGGQCVQCASDTQCASTTATPYCNTATNSCVSCTALPPSGCIDRDVAKPHCSEPTGSCVKCWRNTHCSAAVQPSNTPICLNATCVACNAPGIANPLTVCHEEIGGVICTMSGPDEGTCVDPLEPGSLVP